MNIGTGNNNENLKGRNIRINSSSSFKESIQNIIPAALTNIMESFGNKVNTLIQGNNDQIKIR